MWRRGITYILSIDLLLLIVISLIIIIGLV